MSQEEMDAMFAAMRGESAPAPAAPTPAPAAPAAPTPAPAAPTPAAAPAPAAPAAAMPQQAVPAPGQAPYYPYPPAAGMDPMMLHLLNQMQQTQMQMMEMMKNVKAPAPAPAAPSNTGSSIIRPLESSQIHESSGTGEEDKANQEMLMKVPLEVSVEIGRTKRLVRDILEFTQGTLVVLDKMAGEQVDLFVNGQCIAKGDIVVVEDNFGIRITEIVSKEIHPESL